MLSAFRLEHVERISKTFCCCFKLRPHDAQLFRPRVFFNTLSRLCDIDWPCKIQDDISSIYNNLTCINLTSMRYMNEIYKFRINLDDTFCHLGAELWRFDWYPDKLRQKDCSV